MEPWHDADSCWTSDASRENCTSPLGGVPPERSQCRGVIQIKLHDVSPEGHCTLVLRPPNDPVIRLHVFSGAIQVTLRIITMQPGATTFSGIQTGAVWPLLITPTERPR